MSAARGSDALRVARARMAELYLADETALVDVLIAQARLSPGEQSQADTLAHDLVVRVRAGRRRGGLDAFLSEYALTTNEGVVLMCLAEALLRVPDAATADRLIRDKIEQANWAGHLGKSPSFFVNASTWALLLTGRVVHLGGEATDWPAVFGRLLARSGEPLIRQALTVAIRILGGQFVLGRTMAEALERGRPWAELGYRFSFDMLGEAAMTQADAARYFDNYAAAIGTMATVAPAGWHTGEAGSIFSRNSISVKLSALHPRFEQNQRERVLRELVPRLVALARAARAANVGLTLDAEEADRLELQLDALAATGLDPELAGWEGLGLAVQAYGKRATAVIAWLAALARKQGRRIPVRLVKGAYWDTEIKRAQEQGLEGYPVFTRKAATDTSYLACARLLLADPGAFYPMFATHNAHTVAAVHALARHRADWEFQRLHGMGEDLFAQVIGPDQLGVACRLYAPVGAHEDLLAYLVRRLLENGANTSFVNRLADDEAPIEEIIADPVATLAAVSPKPHPRIPLPVAIFPGRRNSRGVLLTDPVRAGALLDQVREALQAPLTARPMISGAEADGPAIAVVDPALPSRMTGHVVESKLVHVEQALQAASRAQADWDNLGGAARAAILERAADLFEERLPALVALCVREAGKTVANGVGDVREAVDFLRYYAAQARADFAAPRVLAGPTGERNELSLHGRGVFACISPWNFPVAIFTGQVAAALAAGNAVVAKPAEQTPLVAFLATRLLHQGGVPCEVLHFLPGPGPEVGGRLVSDQRVNGICFTGSLEVAQTINRQLAGREGAIATLIAETGGLNAMIADSTSLPEQLVRDVLASAFDSAGQRCSALRVLFVQEDIAERVLALLAGAMAELHLGDPLDLATDVGPLIDAAALANLTAHAERMMREARLIASTPLPAQCAGGHFFAPRAFEIATLDQVGREVFGPILHVVRFSSDRLGEVCEAINASGYGLTLGVHSRIQETADFIRHHARVGNLYVNRNQIGAVVGAQPFGGEGLSGTGPKAGGPGYLHRFAVERVACTNTAAAGGNAALFSL